MGNPLPEAMAAHQAGRLEEADRLYRAAVQADPANAQALRLRGILARERGDLPASARLLARAAEVVPGEAAPLAELALTRMAANDLDGALRDLRAALLRDPAHGQSLANLGALLQYRGHIHEAIGCHEQALALDGDDVEVRCNLAKALSEAGRGVDALALCDVGLDAAPAHPLLLAARGAVCCDIEDFAGAVTALEAALVRSPDTDTAWVSLAYAHTRRGETQAAVDALGEALRVNPASGRATADLINLLAGSGRVDRALDLAGGFLEQHPAERHVLAALGFALRDAGDVQSADALVDHRRLITVTALEPATGLREQVLADSSLVASPASRATRGGLQTGEFDPGSEFLARIDPAVRAHPVMAELPPRWSLRAWATVLTAGGHQLPHIHPEAWLSGVYYVDLPPAMGPGEAGFLEFGAPPPRFLVRTPPPLRAVEPVAGRLVLFPSYFHHRTLPFTGAGERISIAFDVVAGGVAL